MSTSSADLDSFVSLILPVRDAEPQIGSIIANGDRVMRSLFRHYEIVIVDDASRDNTSARVGEIQRQIDNIQHYVLNRRSGFDIAMTAGLDNCIGDFVMTLNPVTDPMDLVQRMWEEMRNGAELVCGIRVDGRGGVWPRLHRLFYRMFNATTGLQVPLGISGCRLYSRRIVSYITQSNDRHLWIQVLPLFAATQVRTFEYAPLGQSPGFGERSIVDSTVHGITVLLLSSMLPLRLMTLVALAASFLSLIFAGYVVAVALIKADVVEGWVSLALPMAVMFFLFSTIAGILSEYIYMLAQQGSNRPIYSIAQQSTSSAIGMQQKLNVVERAGDFARRQP
jgi:polyisoprenyl-phosphate glycosyltransferase